MTHTSPQRRNEWRITLALKDQRVERCQAPILPGPIERIGGRANGGSGGDEILVRPCLGTVGVDADSEVAIEPERQSGFPASRRCRRKLPVGFPLQILKEFYTVPMCGREFGDLG